MTTLTYKVTVGKRVILPKTTSWVTALRALLDNANLVAESGYASVIRSDDTVIAAIDLDIGVLGRK